MINLFRIRRTRDHQLPATGPTGTLRARVVFVTFHRSGVVIDLMAQSDAFDTAAVIALDVLLPNAPWAFAAAVALEAWVSRSAEIGLDFRHRGGHSKVLLADRTYRMLLDLHRDPALIRYGSQRGCHDEMTGAARKDQRSKEATSEASR